MGLQQKWKAKSEILREPADPASQQRQPNLRSYEIAATTEIVELRGKLEEARARQVQLIDPKLVRPSRLMNRHESTFDTAEYRELVESVRVAGGNEQPVTVRRIDGDAVHRFEVIAGLRRHRAALETGTPLKAMVEDADDSRAYDIMSRENSQRADLSPWEWGRHYIEGLAIKKCTQKELAAIIGTSETHVAQAIPIGELPETVVRAFPSPLDIQFRWGPPLRKALAVAEARVLRRAEELIAQRTQRTATQEQGPTAKEVVQALVEAGRRGRAKTPKDGEAARKSRPIQVGKIKGALTVAGGRTRLELKTALSANSLDRLEVFVKQLLAG